MADAQRGDPVGAAEARAKAAEVGKEGFRARRGLTAILDHPDARFWLACFFEECGRGKDVPLPEALGANERAYRMLGRRQAALSVMRQALAIRPRAMLEVDGELVQHRIEAQQRIEGEVTRARQAGAADA